MPCERDGLRDWRMVDVVALLGRLRARRLAGAQPLHSGGSRERRHQVPTDFREQVVRRSNHHFLDGLLPRKLRLGCLGGLGLLFKNMRWWEVYTHSTDDSADAVWGHEVRRAERRAIMQCKCDVP